jgi:hypothetical protein
MTRHHYGPLLYLMSTLQVRAQDHHNTRAFVSQPELRVRSDKPTFLRPSCCFKRHEDEGKSAGKCAAGPLLRQTDLADHFGVPRVGAQRIEREISAELYESDIALHIRDVEPLEGVVRIAQTGV